MLNFSANKFRKGVERGRPFSGSSILSLLLLALAGVFPDQGAAEVTYPIVDTNQSLCYDSMSGAETSCSGAGHDADYSGYQPSYTVSVDGKTVKDNVTGLTWTQTPDLDGDGNVDVDDKLIQSEAVTYCDDLTTGGYDWRLPDIKELYSLILFTGGDPSGYNGTDTSQLTPFIDDTVFQPGFGDTSAGERIIDGQYATTSFYVSPVGAMNGDAVMFGVNFIDGRIKGYPYETGKTFYVMCVSGSSNYGVNDFSEKGDETVSDYATGLMWQQDDSSSTNWDDAVSICESATTAGYSDWRLPNVKELESIVDYSRSPDSHSSAAINPIFNTTSLTNEEGVTDWGWYWASTTHATWDGSGTAAAYVTFGRALGYLNITSDVFDMQDVHGAGAQRSNNKMTEANEEGASSADLGYGTFYYKGPQGDILRKDNKVRCVRDITEVTFDFSNSPDGEYASGTTFNMTDTNVTSTSDRFGNSNSAYSFNGSNSTLKGEWSRTFDQELTISAWFKGDPNGVMSNAPRLVEFSSDGTWATGTAIRYSLDGSLHAWCEEDGGTRMGAVDDTTSYKDGEWHHVAYVHNSSGATLYVDGEVVDTSDSPCSGIVDANYLSIGSNYQFSNKDIFSGDIDEVKIYDRALTETEVYELADQLALEVSFDGSTEGTTPSGDLTPASASNLTATTDHYGKSDSAYSFNGSNSVWRAAWSQSFSDELTISTWFKGDSSGSMTNYPRLVEFSSDGTYFTSTAVAYNPDGTLRVWCEDSGTGGRRGVITSTSTYKDDEWHHVAYVHNASGAKLYVDGSEEGSTSQPCGDIADAGYLSIGSNYQYSNKDIFAGDMDEVKIYDRALSQGKIWGLIGSSVYAKWGSTCLNAVGHPGMANGTDVNSWDCDEVIEKWYLGVDQKIHAAWDGNVCLDVSGTNSTTAGSNVQLWQCDDVTETWTFGDDGKIYAAWDTDMCLNIIGNNNPANGQSANIWYCDQVVETWDWADAEESAM